MIIALIKKLKNKRCNTRKERKEVYYLINDEDGDIVYSQLKDRREWEAFIDRKLNITRCLHEDVIILDEVEILEDNTEETLLTAYEKEKEKNKELEKKLDEISEIHFPIIY